MENSQTWSGRFKKLFINNRFVLFLLILLLIGLNVLVFYKISFVFRPITVLLKTVLLPVLLTGAIYYLLNPLVDWLERKGLKRVYTIAALYLLIIGLLTIVIVSVIPLLQEQIIRLIDNFPRYSYEVQLQFESVIGSDFFHQFQSTTGFDPSTIGDTFSQQATTILNSAWSSIGGFLGTIKDVILAIATVPFILFYLLKDGKKLPQYILRFVPIRLRQSTHTVMTEMNGQISHYIRGQIIVSFCIGILMYIGFLIIGLDYSLILALIASCTSIVPYLGPAIAITPALIIASVTSPFMLLKLIVVWTVVQLIEGKFISPQIMGKTLRVHPITIIFVILTAGNLFGFFGILLAVPGYAVLKVVVTHLFDWFERKSHLYDSIDPAQPSESNEDKSDPVDNPAL
ncbi:MULTISPECIES: AI-2E family transporter [unclassified Paenibacillus]|uniref:AI-2E family transporter n=1 Tax=unclassified Paenibacillus TaxID=185978 RepID=UPI0008382D70|nr:MULTISPECIES: AI-2E family transporter [unclassified Paenibacillus]NWL88777.1 AI-2E family transporter [Paenibacillus sp. 79R4]